VDRVSRKPPEIQLPGGDYGQQLNNHQSQSPERSSGTSTSKAPQQSVSGFVRSTLRSLSPFSKTPRSSPEATITGHGRTSSQSGSATATSGSLAPEGGRTNTAIASNSLIPPGRDPASYSHDNVTAAIAPANLSTQTLDPVSTPTSDPQTLLTVLHANHSPSAVPLSSSSHVWQKTLEIAQKSLAKYKLPSLELGNLQSQSAAENIQALVAELEIAHRESKDRQWRYKDRQGNEVAWVERLGNILKSVDKYTKIVDTAIQHHPNITSLVWAGARAILQVCHGLSGEAVH